MTNAPRRPPAGDGSSNAPDDVSISGGRRASDERILQRPAGSGSDVALETFEQNVERGTGDARLLPDGSDGRASDPD